MLIQIVAFLCGLFFIVKGADWLVDWPDHCRNGHIRSGDGGQFYRCD